MVGSPSRPTGSTQINVDQVLRQQRGLHSLSLLVPLSRFLWITPEMKETETEGLENAAGILTFLLKEALSKYPSIGLQGRKHYSL